ncbi:hypothetical protein [Nocardioides aequoreus]|uniref:hypothetical protein n=1 Tax=Nocardioides aequoreus TaxID=397278 RepID=UPI0004C2D2E5|nr:hypothetical protein [Nocardioides aequoreus]
MRRHDEGRHGRRARAAGSLVLMVLAALALSRLLRSGDGVLLVALVVALALVGALVASLPLLDRLPRRTAPLSDARLLRRQELVRRLEAGPHTATYVVGRR